MTRSGWTTFPQTADRWSYTYRIAYGQPWQNGQQAFLSSGGQMYSQSNRYRLTNMRNGFDAGGPFYLERKTATNTPGVFTDGNGRGKFLTNDYPPLWIGDMQSVPQPFSTASLNSVGATAIARSTPTNPIFDGAAFLGELIADIPRLPGAALREATHGIRSLLTKGGEEYLNAVFGLRPLIADMKSFWKSCTHAGEILRQYDRDRNKCVRRRYSFPPTSGTRERQVRYFGGPSVSYNGTHKLVERWSTEKWFSGMFQYRVPLAQGALGKLERIAAQGDKLFGVIPDVSTLWELTPWSWAVDWFTNAGDVLHNVSAFTSNGLVMRYGYVMCHQVLEREHWFTPDSWGSTSYRHERWDIKQRRQADPFGFGITDTGLSPGQLGILAALGLTKGLGRDNLPSSIDRRYITPGF